MAGDIIYPSDLKVMFSVRGIGFDQDADRYTVDLYTGSKKLTFQSTDSTHIKRDDDGNFYLVVPGTSLEPGSLMLVVSAQIRDEDFPGGYRAEVSKPIRLKPVVKI